MKIVAFTLLFYQATAIGFKQADEAEYLSKFGSLIADSYSALDDGYASLFNECKASSTSQTGVVLPERILTASSDLITHNLQKAFNSKLPRINLTINNTLIMKLYATVTALSTLPATLFVSALVHFLT